MDKKYKSLKEFYPFYLTEHRNDTSRVLHFIGTSLFLMIVLLSIIFCNWRILLLGPIAGYGFAWVGHFFYEKNRPATFTYPLMSLASDFIMFYHFLTGQLRSKMEEAKRIMKITES
ncbi:MAG: DUF962 domain-containing protein [Saprospiraceae bacterium]|nr:DUF962 domain-containing protein [Saprospiraceae bacterium]